MGNCSSRSTGYDSEMPVSSGADNRGFISFHFVLLRNVLYAKALFRAGRVGGNKTCKKLTLNKENTKSFMLSALLKAFPGRKPKQLPWSMWITQCKTGFLPLLPLRSMGPSVFLFLFHFFHTSLPPSFALLPPSLLPFPLSFSQLFLLLNWAHPGLTIARPCTCFAL